MVTLEAPSKPPLDNENHFFDINSYVTYFVICSRQCGAGFDARSALCGDSLQPCQAAAEFKSAPTWQISRGEPSHIQGKVTHIFEWDTER